jgi:hypothetical protein
MDKPYQQLVTVLQDACAGASQALQPTDAAGEPAEQDDTRAGASTSAYAALIQEIVQKVYL